MKKIVCSFIILIAMFINQAPPLATFALSFSNPFSGQDIIRNNQISQSILHNAQRKTLIKEKPQYKSGSKQPQSVYYNVIFKSSASLYDIYQCVSCYTYKLLGQSKNRLFSVRLDDPHNFRQKYDSIIKNVSRDASVKACATADDTYFNEQWELPDIKIPDAWDTTKGLQTLKVAVIDTGFDRAHEDFNPAQILNGVDVANTGGNVVCDYIGHGTEVTSVIAAATNNGKGISGAGWNVSVMPYCVSDALGNIYDSNIISAITMAADSGCSVINMSLGSYEDDSAMQNAIDYAKAKGCIIVAAAGNEGNIGNDKRGGKSYPASFDGVISVASVDRNNHRSSFSQYNSSVEVSAPGERILVAQAGSQNGYTVADGTSFSSPYVASVAALVRSVNGNITDDQFRRLIEMTSTDLGDRSKDNYYGWGLINAAAMVKAAVCPIVYGVEENGLYNSARTVTFSSGKATLNGGNFQSGTSVGDGDYTLVVNDGGNTTTVHFTVDTKAPVVTGITNYAIYNTDTKISFNEGTATLNGQPFNNGGTVCSEGKYTLIVTDSAQNVTNTYFTISKTHPVIYGVEDGKTYHSAVKFTYTGYCSVLLNGNNYAGDGTISQEGQYTLSLVSGSFTTTVHFTISDLPDKTIIGLPPLSKWAMDSASGYLCAIPQNEKMLYFINTKTMNVDSTIDLPSVPTDVICDNGKLYIALDSENKIQLMDIASKSLGTVYTTARDPYHIVKDGNEIFYTQQPPFSEVHRYDTATGDDIKIDSGRATNSGIFYSPSLALNANLHILYIGESQYSFSRLYYYDINQGKIIASTPILPYAGHDYSTCLTYDGKYVFWGYKILAPDDPAKPLPASIDVPSSPLCVINGCVITDDSSIYDETNFKKVGTFSFYPSLFAIADSNNLLYYDAANNRINKATANSSISIDNITGLLSGIYSSSEAPSGGTVQLNSTTNKLQINRKLNKWIGDDANHMIYALSSSDKSLIFLNEDTFQVDNILHFNSTPTDIFLDNGKLYVAFYQSNLILQVDAATRSIVKTITTDTNPYYIAADGNYLFYAQQDQWCEVHEINLSTNTDTKITDVNNSLFYQPRLAVNSKAHLLYIADNELHYYDYLQGKMLSAVDVSNNGLIYDGNYVITGMAADPLDGHITGELANNGQLIYAGSGVVITSSSEAGLPYIYDEKTFMQIGKGISAFSLFSIGSSGQIFYFSDQDNSITCIQNQSGTVNAGNIVGLLSATPVAPFIQPVKGQKIDTYTLGLQNININKWTYDETDNLMLAISGPNMSLLFIDADTLDIQDVLYLKSQPSDLYMDTGKLYITLPDTKQIAVVDIKSHTLESTIYTANAPNHIVKDGDKLFYTTLGFVYEYGLATKTEKLITSMLSPILAINNQKHILYAADSSMSSCSLIYYDIAQEKKIGEKSGYNYPQPYITFDGTNVYYAGHDFSCDTPTELGDYKEQVLFAKNGYVFSNTGVTRRGNYSGWTDLPMKAYLVEMSGQNALFIYNNDNLYMEKELSEAPSSVSGVKDGQVYNDTATVTFNSGTAYLDNQPINSGAVVTGPGYHNLLYFDKDDNCELLEFKIRKSLPDDGLEVEFKDDNLKQALLAQNVDENGDNKITRGEMRDIDSGLSLGGCEIGDLTGLEYATGISFLSLPGNSIENLGPISGLTQLTSLNIDSNKLSNISSLSKLTGLKDLSLSNNQISSVAVISAMTNLSALNLSQNSISDISSFAALTQLNSLNLSNNQIADIKPLGGLTVLCGNNGYLDLSNNLITDISALSSLSNLTDLCLSGNKLSSLTPLQGLTGLYNLELSGCGLSSTAALSGLTGLQSLNISGNSITGIHGLSRLTGLLDLNLSDNKIQDISTVGSFTQLQNLNIADCGCTCPNFVSSLSQLEYLDASNNNIISLTWLTDLGKLNYLSLSGNKIADISALETFSSLEMLDLSDNQVQDIHALASLTGLSVLNLSSNCITDISPLRYIPLSSLDVSNNYLDLSSGSLSTDIILYMKDAYKTEVTDDPQKDIPPVITISPYNTAPTNQNVTVTATTDKGTLNESSHTFTENGSFTFVATDSSGTLTSKIVTISNIDKTPPVITIGSYNTTATTEPITVTASTNEGSLNEISHTFTQNGSFTFTATDAAGNQTAKTVTVTNIISAISSTSYNIDTQNRYISKIGANTKVSTLISKCANGSCISVYKGDIQMPGDAKIGTGMTVKMVVNGVVQQTLTAVVTGDTDGNGDISITDFLQVEAVILGKSKLSGASGAAADTDKNGSIAINDLVQIKSHILGKSSVQP